VTVIGPVLVLAVIGTLLEEPGGKIREIGVHHSVNINGFFPDLLTFFLRDILIFF
jgi:hypothetical protein